MGTKRTIPLFVVLIIFLLSLPIFGAGCNSVIGEPPSDVSPELDTNLPPEFDTVAETWRMLSEIYVDKGNLDAEKLSQGAIRA